MLMRCLTSLYSCAGDSIARTSERTSVLRRGTNFQAAASAARGGSGRRRAVARWISKMKQIRNSARRCRTPRRASRCERRVSGSMRAQSPLAARVTLTLSFLRERKWNWLSSASVRRGSWTLRGAPGGVGDLCRRGAGERTLRRPPEAGVPDRPGSRCGVSAHVSALWAALARAGGAGRGRTSWRHGDAAISARPPFCSCGKHRAPSEPRERVAHASRCGVCARTPWPSCRVPHRRVVVLATWQR